MHQDFPWKWVLLASIGSLSLLILTYILAGTVYLSPDTIGLACGAEHFFSYGEFSTVRTPFTNYDYVPCWTSQVYAVVQLLVAAVRFPLPNIEWAIGVFHGFLSFLFPLSAATLIWRLKHQKFLSGWVAVVAALAPAAHSTLQLTPQAYIGTTLLFFALSIVIHPHTSIWKWGWMIPCFLILYFTHTLTFFFGTIFLGIIWLIQKPLKHSVLFFLGSLVVGVLGSLLSLSRTTSITNIAQGLWEQMQIIDVFQQRPIWDHASVFGYVLIPLAIFGFTSHVWNKKEKWLLAVWVAIPLLLSHLNIFGLSFLPHRMVWYLIPSILLLSGAGVMFLIDHIRSWISTLTLGLMILILSIHTIVLTQDNLKTYTQPILLTNDYLGVIDELKKVPEEDNILTLMTAQDRLNLHLPRNIQADVISFPAHQFKNPKTFELAQPYWAFLNETEPDNPLIDYLRSIYWMVENPEQAVNKELYTIFRVSKIVVRKNSSEGKLLKKSNLFSQVYENDTYIILEP